MGGLKLTIVKRLQQGYRILGAVLLLGAAVAFFSPAQFEAIKLAFRYWDPMAITEYRLSRLSTEDFVAQIESSLHDDDIAEARALVALAQEYGHRLPDGLVEKTYESPLQLGLRNFKDFIHGATTGEVRSVSSIGGAMAADYVGVGDIRDIFIQGNHLVQGEDYDKLTLGLSLVGLATVVPGTGAVDLGASVVKTANKAGKLSKPLRRHTEKLATKLIDLPAFRRGLSETRLPAFKIPPVSEVQQAISELNGAQVMKGNFSGFRKLISSIMPIDVSTAKMNFKGAIKTDVAQEIAQLAKEASTISTAGSIKTTFRALEHADDASDLSRFSKLTLQLGEKTSAVIKILGKSAIKLGKLAYWLITIMIAVLVWLFCAFWFVFSGTRLAYRLIAQRAGKA